MFGHGRYLAPIAAWTAATIASAALLALAAPPASAATAQQTILLLNAQRLANGLPATITEDPTWSSDCQEHDNYMKFNGLTHNEQPGNPGYTAGGAWAGLHSVIVQNETWDSGNPYEDAPLHLDQLLAPRLQVLGSADAAGFSCTTTFPGWVGPDPPAPVVYAYPGNGAQIYASELALEQPWTPGQLVGIRSGTRTGPYLIVFADAPGASPLDNPATLSGATLTGPNGPVAIATVDGTTPVPGGQATTLSAYISPGGFIIPLKPLIAGSTYAAHVVVTFAGAQIPDDWSFTTVGASARSVLSARGHRLSFASASPQRVSVTFTRAGGQHARSVTIFPGHGVKLALAPGSWQVCGHQPGTNRFAPWDGCITIVVTGSPSLKLGPGRIQRTAITFRLRFASVLRNRTATLTLTPLTVRCRANGCVTSVGRAVSRQLVLRSHTLRLPLPAPGHGVDVELDTAAFQLADAPWSAAHAVRRFVRR